MRVLRDSRPRLPQSLIDRAYDAFQRFFALPAEVKMQYHLKGTGGARGYTPFGIETAKDSRYPDLKEFWHIGREIAARFEIRRRDGAECLAARNSRFPRGRLRALRSARHARLARAARARAAHRSAGKLFRRQDESSAIRSCARSTIRRSRRRERAERPRRRARGHQPDHAAGRRERGRARSASHAGEWVPFTAEADTIVVNIGDMLQRLTNHVYPSTTHRVANPPGETRAQAALFGAVLPASESGFRHRRAAIVHRRGPSEPLRSRSPRTTICRNGCARSS